LEGGGPVPAPAADAQGELANVATTSGTLGTQFQSDRVLILTAQLHFRGADPWAAADRVQSVARGLGGEIIGVSQSGTGDDKAATVTVRVPNDRFNDALAQLKAIEGTELLSAQVTGEDRTEQFVDLEARLRAKQQEEARYLALLARANTIDEILKIDQVLSQVRTQVEQLQGQLNALKNRSSMATVTVAISTAAIAPRPLDTVWEPARTFQAATAALLSVLRLFADAAIWALVWLWLPLLGLGLALALSRARTRPTGVS
jgi:hypothetical protein